MPIHTVRRLLFELPKRCEGLQDEGTFLLESAPSSEGGFRLNINTHWKICIQLSEAQKESFLQDGLLWVGLQSPMPADIRDALTYFERRFRLPLQSDRHGNIAIKVRKLRDGRGQWIFQEPRNRSFFMSPSSIEFFH